VVLNFGGVLAPPPSRDSQAAKPKLPSAARQPPPNGIRTASPANSDHFPNCNAPDDLPLRFSQQRASVIAVGDSG
jgi:hypothetical protein